jgi:hypothetical protein
MITDCASADLASQWAPRLFDFSVAGWLLIGIYLAATAACARRLRHEPYAVRFWAYLTAALLVFLVIRLFSLTDILTLAGRCGAVSDDWYQARRPFQIAVIAVIGLIGLASAAVAALMRTRVDERIAILAIVFLFFFIIARAVSFHDLAAALGLPLVAGHLNGAIEAFLLVAIILAASARGARSGKRKTPPRTGEGRS